MLFGVFDGIHEGHRAMLREAKQCGDYLIAAVAQDHIVEHLKGHLPKANFAERFEHLKEEDSVDEVVIGDAHLSTWQVVRKHQPEVIALGYDQTALKEDLEKRFNRLGCQPEIKVLKSFEPDTHHNFVINQKLKS